MFIGLVDLEGTIRDYFQAVDPGTGAPVEPDAAPRVQIYGPSGLLTGATVTAAPGHQGVVIGATNASPVVIQSVGHNLTTGSKVVVSGVTGNIGANGTFVVIAVDADHFSLTGSTGTGTYSGGGTWHAAGFFSADLQALGSAGFDKAENYLAYWSYTVSGSPRSELHTFGVT